MMILLLILCVGGIIFLNCLLLRRFGYRELQYSLCFLQDEASEGDMVTLVETISSRKLLPLPWVKAELTTDAALVFAAGQSAVSKETRFVSSFFCLMPYRTIERRWNVQCSRRGVFKVSHAVVVLSDLFGLIELSEPYPDATAEIVVLPAVREEIDVLPQPFWITGDMMRNRQLMPDRFAICGIRPYMDGDMLRDLSMTATARSEEPLVWQYQETATSGLTILLNLETRITDRDVVSDKAAFEEAIRVCAAYLGQAARYQKPVRLYANALIDGQPVQTPYLNAAMEMRGFLHVLAKLPYEITARFERLFQQVYAEDTAAAILVIAVRPDAYLKQIAEKDTRVVVAEIHSHGANPQ